MCYYEWRNGYERVVRNFRKFIQRICDELVDPEGSEWSADGFHAALGRCILSYRFLLLRENLADFEHLQVWAHDLLRSLKRRGVIAGYDQAAMLLHSVQEQAARPYLAPLEKGSIPVRRVSAGHDCGGQHRTRRPTLTVTTIHQAKVSEWDVVVKSLHVV